MILTDTLVNQTDTLVNKIYGYVRVSTKEQNEDRQLLAMAEFGVPSENIFIDKQSGKDFDRPAYQSLMQQLQPNDTIVFKSIDRLGRNFFEILEQWKVITVEKQAAIYVIDMPILDTRNHQNDLTSQLISSLVLQLLSYVAQIERDFIRSRQAEGIKTAMARGVKFGRKAKIKPSNYDEVLSEWLQNKISAREAGRRLNVHHDTFLKWTRQ